MSLQMGREEYPGTNSTRHCGSCQGRRQIGLLPIWIILLRLRERERGPVPQNHLITDISCMVSRIWGDVFLEKGRFIWSKPMTMSSLGRVHQNSGDPQLRRFLALRADCSPAHMPNSILPDSQTKTYRTKNFGVAGPHLCVTSLVSSKKPPFVPVPPLTICTRQHLYRVHSRPDHYCNRCFSVFKDGEALEAHARSSDICENCETKPAERFPGTMSDKQLSEIKRKRPGEDGVQAWFSIYKTLFPSTPPPPSPRTYFYHLSRVPDLRIGSEVRVIPYC